MGESDHYYYYYTCMFIRPSTHLHTFFYKHSLTTQVQSKQSYNKVFQLTEFHHGSKPPVNTPKSSKMESSKTSTNFFFFNPSTGLLATALEVFRLGHWAHLSSQRMPSPGADWKVYRRETLRHTRQQWTQHFLYPAWNKRRHILK